MLAVSEEERTYPQTLLVQFTGTFGTGGTYETSAFLTLPLRSGHRSAILTLGIRVRSNHVHREPTYPYLFSKNSVYGGG